MAGEKKIRKQNDKLLGKSMRKYVEKKRPLFSVTIQENEQVCFSGSQSVIDFIRSKDLHQVTLSSLTDHLLKTETMDSRYASEKQLSFPLLQVQYKGPHWTTKIGQRALQTYMTLLGTIFFIRNSC